MPPEIRRGYRWIQLLAGRAGGQPSYRVVLGCPLVVSEGLADPALAQRVSVAGGVTTLADGPFAEFKEHLAGFYLVECDRERAVEIAARIPDGVWGLVEVRPVLDMSTPG